MGVFVCVCVRVCVRMYSFLFVCAYVSMYMHTLMRMYKRDIEYVLDMLIIYCNSLLDLTLITLSRILS